VSYTTVTRAVRLTASAIAGVLLALVVALLAAGPSLAPAPPGIGGASASPSASPSPGPPLAPAALDVDGQRAREHTAFFADRARGGRYTASPGYDEAARYMAERFAELGLDPLGDGGTYFQRFSMPLVDLAATPVLSVTAPSARAFTHRVDFTERVGGTFGSGGGEGGLVFIGSGVATPGASDFDKVDVRGKVAIVITGGRNDPARDLAARGAIGAIYVTSGTLLKFSYLPRFEPRILPGLIVTTAVANELLAPAGKTVNELIAEVQVQGRASPAPSPAFELPQTVRIGVALTPVREVEATNVVGLLRGGDPEASKRAVVVGGHLDGVGTDPDGAVFPAANDNASGPGLTIEVARTLLGLRERLRSSVIFVAFAGEEQGLNGSEAFLAQTATIPGRRESLIAYVNLDVVGCCGGSVSASDESEGMVDRVERAAEALGVPFSRGGRGSSDQASFARRGVPATLLNWSSIGPIHTTADTIDLVTAERLGIIGRVAALVTLELAAGR